MKICNNGITRDMTAEEIAAWQRSVVGLSPAATEAELAAAQVAVDRDRLIAEVEATTEKLLADGHEYPPSSGHIHSLEDRRITVYEGAKANKAAITNLDVITKGKRVITLTGAAEIEAMHAALLARYLQITQGGAAIIKAAWLPGANIAALRTANKART